jgi:hypothetical protein
MSVDGVGVRVMDVVRPGIEAVPAEESQLLAGILDAEVVFVMLATLVPPPPEPPILLAEIHNEAVEE